MFHQDIQTPKFDAQRSTFDDIRSVRIANETLSRVFDVQGSYGSWKTWKVLEFYSGHWSWKVLEICLTQQKSVWKEVRRINVKILGV